MDGGTAGEPPDEDEDGGPAPCPDENALEALELGYGAAYRIGHGEEHGWRAARRDGLGGYLEGAGPGELRAAMDEDCALKPVRFWCRHCGQRAAYSGGTSVHAETLRRTGPDGHQASAVAGEPPLWRAAREIGADYGGAFAVSAKFGILRAGWAQPGAPPGHFEADDEEGLRRRLDEAVRGALRDAGEEPR